MKPPTPLLTVSAPPHIHCGRTIRGIMLETIAALVPAAAMAVVWYGLPALRVMALCCATAVIVEAACFRVMEKTAETDDYHGLLTGLLFSFLLPASAPWWLAVFGTAITITLGKMIFGGVGGTPLNAAALGWASCRISWPGYMDVDATMLSAPFESAVSGLKYFGPQAVETFTATDLLMGRQLSGLGEAQVGALLLGGLWLTLRGHVRWEIPLSFLVAVAATASLYQFMDPQTYAGPLFHLLAGGTVFAAFFLMPEGSSSPNGRVPMLLYGLMGGVLLIIVRVYGMYPDGIAFAVLLANLAAPLLERIRPKPFGAR